MMIMDARRPISMDKGHFAAWRGALVPRRAGLEATLDCLWAFFRCANQNFQLEGGSPLIHLAGGSASRVQTVIISTVTSLGQLVTVQVASVC